MHKFTFLVALVIVGSSVNAYAQVWECRDSEGHNYTVSQNVPSDVCVRSLDKERAQVEAEAEEKIQVEVRRMAEDDAREAKWKAEDNAREAKWRAELNLSKAKAREAEAKEKAVAAKAREDETQKRAKLEAALKKLEDDEKANIEKLKALYQKALEKRSVVCVGERLCKKYFQLTQIFISKNSDMKLQIISDSVLETYNPTEPFQIGMHGTKTPGKNDSERIDIEVLCKSDRINSLCMKREIAIYDRFRPFVEASIR